MTIPEVIDELTATADSLAKFLGPDDARALHALHMAEAVKKLHTAARHTIVQNLHLADGDNCTLFELREAIDYRPRRKNNLPAEWQTGKPTP